MVTEYIFVLAVPPPLAAVTDVVFEPMATEALPLNLIDGFMLALLLQLLPSPMVSVAPLLVATLYLVGFTDEDAIVITGPVDVALTPKPESVLSEFIAAVRLEAIEVVVSPLTTT